MSHYHISIPVDAEDVKIIKREFEKYLEKAGGFTITVRPDNYIEESDELRNVLKKLFTQFLILIETGNFHGLN
jgi:hypothetical protein